MNTEKALMVLIGLVATVAVAVASFTAKWVFDHHAEMAALNERLTLKFADIDDSLITLADDTDDITRINRQLTKHWRLHNWSKDQVAELRHAAGMQPVHWPPLE